MFFRKDDKTPPEHDAAHQQQDAPAQQSNADNPEQPATSAASSGPSVLTAESVLEGNLATSGELHIDGTVHGSVQAAVVIIGSNGAVHGNVVGEEVFIRGRVIGPICGVNVVLVSGSHVEGDIINQTIAIETGAYVDGKIRRSEDPLGEWHRMWYGDEYEQGELEGESDQTGFDVSSASQGEAYAYPPADESAPNAVEDEGVPSAAAEDEHGSEAHSPSEKT